MPWSEVDGGYTKKHSAPGRGGFVRNPRQYEKLRRLGMSKERAAAITNSDNRKVSKMSSVSAFGVPHAVISKHYIGDHGEGAAHTRDQHGDLRRRRRATNKAYGAAANTAYHSAHEAERQAHPVVHAFQSHAQRQGYSTADTNAERAGQKGMADWKASPAGVSAHEVRDRTKADWNPRYAKRRKARMDAARAIPATPAIAKSAFGIEHTVSKAAGDVDTPSTKANPPRPSAGRQAAGTAFGAFHSAAAGKKGKKLAAVGSSLGHGMAGEVLGAVPGAVIGAATRQPELGAGLSAAGGLGGNIIGTHRAVMSNQAKGRYKPEH